MTPQLPLAEERRDAWLYSCLSMLNLGAALGDKGVEGVVCERKITPA